jgi:hypothetical protein
MLNFKKKKGRVSAKSFFIRLSEDSLKYTVPILSSSFDAIDH